MVSTKHNFNVSKSKLKRKDNKLYNLLLGYTILFFFQFAGRFPVFQPLRLELVIGIILLITIISKIAIGEIRLDDNKLNTIAIFFIIVLFATIPFAFVKNRALTTFIRVFKYFSIYLMIIAAIDNEKKAKGFIVTYVILISILFVQPFFLSLLGKGFIYNNHMMRLSGVRGQFGHPNALGMITSIHLPFFYYFMKHSESKFVKITCLGLICMGLRVIMLTQSRTAFLGVIAFIFLLWLFSNKKLIGIVACIVLFSLIWQFSPQQTKDRFLTLTQTNKVMSENDPANLTDDEIKTLGSMNSRLGLMRHTIVAFTEYPILGLGLDCFSSWNGRRYGFWFPPHNTYLQVLSETGTIGFTALAMVIFFTLKNLIKIKKAYGKLKTQDPILSAASSAVFMSYCIFLVVIFFGIELYNNFWWIAGGLSVVLLRIIENKSKEGFEYQ